MRDRNSIQIFILPEGVPFNEEFSGENILQSILCDQKEIIATDHTDHQGALSDIFMKSAGVSCYVLCKIIEDGLILAKNH